MTVLFAGSGLAASATLDALRELRPVLLVAAVPTLLVTPVTGGVRDIRQLMQQAQRDRASQQIGIAGERTAGHVLLLQMRRHWPHGLEAVTYNGGNGALRGVLAGQVSAALVPLPAALPFAAEGRMRLLAIAAGMRHAALDFVPTFAEAGLPEVMASGWHGLFVSPATPAAAVNGLQRALTRTLSSKSSKAVIAALGYTVDVRGPEALRMALNADIEGNQQVIVIASRRN